MIVDPRGYGVAKHEGEFPLAPVRDFLAAAVARFDADGLIDRTPLPRDPLSPGGGALRFPGKLLVDDAGGRLIVADSGHHRVLVATLDGRVVQQFGSGAAGFVDGPAHDARFRRPQGLALDATGAALNVADEENHNVRVVDLAIGHVATVAGTGEQGADRVGGGPGRETPLSSPMDLALVDDQLWIAMAGLHQLWSLDLRTGRVGARAGTGAESIHDGPLAAAAFAQPSGLAVLDGVPYVADGESSAIRRVDPAADRVRRLLGRGLFDFGDRDGVGDQARLQHPLAVAAGSTHDAPGVDLADTYNHKIKRLDPATRRVQTHSGGDPGHVDGPFAAARFWEPSGLARSAHRLYVADTNNHAIRVLDPAAGTVTTLDIRN